LSRSFLLRIPDVSLGSAETTGASGGDETDLLSSGRVSLDRRRMSDVLVVTSSVRMVNRVHADTTNFGPLVTLGLVFEVGAASLEDGLVDTTASRHDSDHGAGLRGNDLLGAGGELEASLEVVVRVADDGRVVSG